MKNDIQPEILDLNFLEIQGKALKVCRLIYVLDRWSKEKRNNRRVEMYRIMARTMHLCSHNVRDKIYFIYVGNENE